VQLRGTQGTGWRDKGQDMRHGAPAMARPPA
jgi:hypothetical protein